MTHDADNNPALLIVDVQKGLGEASLGTRNNPDAETNISALLGAWAGKVDAGEAKRATSFHSTTEAENGF